MTSLGILGKVAPFFAYTDGDRWRPGIGDPTAIGWITVFAYLMTAWLCYRSSRKHLAGSRLRRFWLILAALLFALGINKQLDLQTAFTLAGKNFAKTTGWYEDRRIVQALFIVAIGLSGIAATTALFWYFRAHLRSLWPALAGVAFLLSFIVIRAASFHHVDIFLKSGPGSVRMNWVLELGGILAIAIPSWRAARQPLVTAQTLEGDTSAPVG